MAERWKEPDAPVRLRGAARGVDAALLQVQSAVLPLVRMPLAIRGRSGENLLALLGTATQHARGLAAAADIDIDLAPHLRTRVDHITEVLASSLHDGIGDSRGLTIIAAPPAGAPVAPSAVRNHTVSATDNSHPPAKWLPAGRDGRPRTQETP